MNMAPEQESNARTGGEEGAQTPRVYKRSGRSGRGRRGRGGRGPARPPAHPSPSSPEIPKPETSQDALPQKSEAEPSFVKEPSALREPPARQPAPEQASSRSIQD